MAANRQTTADAAIPRVHAPISHLSCVSDQAQASREAMLHQLAISGAIPRQPNTVKTRNRRQLLDAKNAAIGRITMHAMSTMDTSGSRLSRPCHIEAKKTRKRLVDKISDQRITTLPFSFRCGINSLGRRICNQPTPKSVFCQSTFRFGSSSSPANSSRNHALISSSIRPALRRFSVKRLMIP